MTPLRSEGEEHHFMQGAGGDDVAGAAMVSVTSRPRGRLVVAFPAGNSGVGLWLDGPMAPGSWSLAGPPRLEPDSPGEAAPPRSHRAHAVRGRILTRLPALVMRHVMAGSLRFLRTVDREGGEDPRQVVAQLVTRLGRLDPDSRATAARSGLHRERLNKWLEPEVESDGRRLVLRWGMLAGVPGHRLVLSVGPGGQIRRKGDGSIEVRPGEAGAMDFLATCHHKPLTPLTLKELFDPEVSVRLDRIARLDAPRARALSEGLGRLRFLCYREKLLAGAWRYLTYFGRDTLLTMRMLRPILAPAAMEAALGSVLERLGPHGEVAHEEDLGDQATLDRARMLLDQLEHRQDPGRPDRHRSPERPSAIDAPVMDRGMVDGDFLLAPALADYVADPRVGTARARQFLSRFPAMWAGLTANLERVLARAQPFASSGRVADMIALRPGATAGDWRDSEDGLGGGRTAASINAILVPQALAAIRTLVASGLMRDAPGLQAPPVTHPGLAAAMESGSSSLDHLQRAWRGALEPFVVRLDGAEARSRAAEYVAKGPFQPDEVKALGGSRPPDGSTRDVAFMSVALDEQGHPIPVASGDGALALFGPAWRDDAAGPLLDPLVTSFPMGLLHPAGLLVASPALSGVPDLWGRFSRRNYHGTVVWAWPMAMAELGLRRLMSQTDRPPESRARYGAAAKQLAVLRRGLSRLGLGELWSWRGEGGQVIPTPFGASAGDVTEANPLQLWSAAWLVLSLNDPP